MKKSIAAAVLIVAAFGSTAWARQVHVTTGSVADAVAKLRPGDYVWAPAVAPAGPMLLIVNLAAQRAIVFRNGVPIAAATVSTGRPGHSTPTGVFTVLQKHVEHRSSKYNNAPMPYMQRLTWYGVALHAGNLPGYPASHGCIRLPYAFAKLLYGVSGLGMTVVITDQPTGPRIAPTPALATRPTDPAPVASGSTQWNPEGSPSGPVSIIVSVADGRGVVLRNGIIIGSAPVNVEGPSDATVAYALKSVDAKGQHWVRIGLAGGSSSEPISTDEFQQFKTDPAFQRNVAAIVRPGTTIVVTPDSLKSGAVAQPLTLIEAEPQPK